MAARIDHGFLRVPVAKISGGMIEAVEEILDRGLIVAGTPSGLHAPGAARRVERRPVAAQRGFPG
jgi:hypothetical protein